MAGEEIRLVPKKVVLLAVENAQTDRYKCAMSNRKG